MLVEIEHKFPEGPYKVETDRGHTTVKAYDYNSVAMILWQSTDEQEIALGNLFAGSIDMLHAIERILHCINSGDIDHGAVEALNRAREKALGVNLRDTV